MTKKQRYNSGIGFNARRAWSGDRVTPNPEQQLMGFYIGQVMDDQDDQRMGRVWVYVPGVSSRRFDENSLPTYGGTTPDRSEESGLNFDQKLRNGWLLVSPLFPFFGSDDFRAPASPDGRDSTKGDVNSYGVWYQPRIGDYVGVVFEAGDPNIGFWIGMVPKQYRNAMVPGNPGRPKPSISNRDESGVPELVSDSAVLPVMDKSSTDEDPRSEDNISSSDLARSIAQSGLSGDVARGAGTSGARRESPSYVFGFKTSGWNYDSEKLNRDADGRQFQNRVNTLSRVNTSGHVFVMDDHPDHQSIRIRTSAGAQILFNDACDCPYIYVQTATGKVWMEMCDGGDLNLFAAGSISMHAENNFNLTVDGDMNVQVNGSMNTLVGGNRRETVAGDTQVLHQGFEQRSNGDEVDHTFDANVRVNYQGDLDSRVTGNKTETVSGNRDITIGGSATENIGGSNFIQAGGTISLETPNIYLNSGLTRSAQPAETAAPPLFPKPGKVSGPPTENDVFQNQVPEKQEYLAPVVPQHQPWPFRCGVGSTRGTNGLVRASPSSQPAPPSDNNTCNKGSVSNNTRPGASRRNANRPDPVVGGTSSFGQEACPTIYQGKPYKTNSSAEQPEYEPVRYPEINEIALPSSYSVSEEGREFIKQQNTFIPRPTLDPLGQNYVVGYGHVVSVGDTIGGKTITSDELRGIASNGSDLEKGFNITPEEANGFLDTEIAATESFIQQEFPLNSFTQDQYDSLSSFVHNVGPENLQNTPEGQEILQAIRNNEYDKAQGLMANYSYLGDEVDCDLLERRRSEIDKFSTMPDADGITQQATEFVPSGETVNVNGWNIDGDVYNAIATAQANNPDLPDGYLFALAARESGFDPNAKNTQSSAAGLFQFIRDTGVGYGLAPERAPGSEVYDPVKNANAAAQFSKDNRDTIASAISREPNATDLYLAHFFGAGGARRFLSRGEANPQGTPATDGFEKQAAVNRRVFFNKDGSPKTYEQIYGEVSNTISCRAQGFSGLTPSV